MWALVAGPPSPSSPFFPPSRRTVVMIRVAWSTLRMTWLALLAMSRSPLAATAAEWGQLSVACAAGPPSPEKFALQSVSSGGHSRWSVRPG